MVFRQQLDFWQKDSLVTDSRDPAVFSRVAFEHSFQYGNTPVNSGMMCADSDTLSVNYHQLTLPDAGGYRAAQQPVDRKYAPAIFW